MTVYKIKSAVLRSKGEKFESADKQRAEARLAVVKRTEDPDARLLAIPLSGR